MTEPAFLRSGTEDAVVTPLALGRGVAAWRQIADALEAGIIDGTFPSGSRLPTEAALAARFGVNRHTLRRALSELAGRGLVRTTQGSGSYVEAPRLPYPIGPNTRFSEIVSREGRSPEGELVESGLAPPPPEAATCLGIAIDADALFVVSIHRADGTPLSTSTSWFPLPRFAGLDRRFARTRSITKALAQIGVADFRRAHTRIGARIAMPSEARRLDLAPGRAVLLIEALNVDPDGAPVQWTQAVFAADRVELRVES